MATTDDEIFYARVKPLHKTKQRCQTFRVFGLNFEVGKWYRLPRFKMNVMIRNEKQDVDLKEHLTNARNEHHVDSESIFQVCNTLEEAQEIEETEKLSEQEKSPASLAVDLTGGATVVGVVKRKPGRPRKNAAELTTGDNQVT